MSGCRTWLAVLACMAVVAAAGTAAAQSRGQRAVRFRTGRETRRGRTGARPRQDAELVKAGELPPVDKRVGEEPLVITTGRAGVPSPRAAELTLAGVT
jgi:hypothetical protein